MAAEAGLRPARGQLRRSRPAQKASPAPETIELSGRPGRRGLVGEPGSPTSLDAVFEALGLGEALELLQRVVLDLADALARHAERAADLLQRARLLALQPEPQLDHLPLPLRERRERALDAAPPQRQRGRVERRLGLLVLDEVPELGLLLFADRLLERDRQLRHAQDLAHLLGRYLELGGDLVRPRLPPEALAG